MIRNGKNPEKLTLAKKSNVHTVLTFSLLALLMFRGRDSQVSMMKLQSQQPETSEVKKIPGQGHVESSVSEEDSEVRIKVCTLCSNPWFILKYV